MIFDTHAHYDDPQFDPDREELLARLPEAGIGRVVDIGATVDSTKRAMALAAQYPWMYAAVGVHPSEIHEMNPDVLAWLGTLRADPKVVAVGEIGLDYYWDKEPEVQAAQRQWFVAQMDLARQVDLPIVIHSRDAAADTLSLVQENGRDLSGVVHCFSYSAEIAMAYVKMGYYIGIGGVVTFKNAKAIKEVVRQVPLERIVVETDCPYLAPEPYRGKRNASIYLPRVISAIAQIKDIPREQAEEVTWKNAFDLYRIDQGIA